MIRMEVLVPDSCVMRIQLRKEGIFKIMSKKYGIDVPKDDDKDMHQAYVEFDNDLLSKIVGLQKFKAGDPDFEGAQSPYRDKLVDL